MGPHPAHSPLVLPIYSGLRPPQLSTTGLRQEQVAVRAERGMEALGTRPPMILPQVGLKSPVSVTPRTGIVLGALRVGEQFLGMSVRPE